MTARRTDVAAFRPIMTPSVVMTPEVSPNAIPVFRDWFMGGTSFARVFGFWSLVFGQVKSLTSRLV